MKRIIPATLMLLISFSVLQAQQQLPANLARTDFSFKQSMRLDNRSLLSSQRTSQQFILDYGSAEFFHATNNTLTFPYFLVWPVNNNFKSGPPVDTSGNFTCKWAAVRFDTLFDYALQVGYPYEGTTITIDTIAIEMNHVNTSGLNDTLIVSVLERANNAIGFTSSDQGITVTNTVLWDTTFISNTSFTPGTPSNSVSQFVVPCGYTLPTGTKFIIKVDYKGPAQDTLNIADINRDDCLTPAGPPPGEAVNASESVFPENSWRYFNLFFPPSNNLNGISPLTLTTVDPLCNLFYFQNWGILALVTLDIPLNATTYQSDSDICPGQTVQLEVAPYGGTPPYQAISWSPTTGLNPPFGSPNPQATVSQTTTYTATIIDADSTVVTKEFTITVREITINAGADETITCGQTANLVATPAGEYIPSTYQWSNGVSTLNNPVTAQGTYTITATNSYGCTASDAVVVNLQGVNQTLNFTIDPVVAGNVGCVGTQLTFTNTSSDQGLDWSWLWKFGDGNQNSSQNASYVYANPGTYAVSLEGSIVIGGSNCPVAPITKNLIIKDASASECDTSTSIRNLYLDARIELFPNPTEGVFTLNFKDLDVRAGMVGIYDIRGAMVYEEYVSVNGNMQRSFDLSRVADGIYFVRIQFGSDLAVKKLSLHR